MVTRRACDRPHPRWDQRLASAGLPTTGMEVRWSTKQALPMPTVGSARSSYARHVKAGLLKTPRRRRSLREAGFDGDVASFDDEGFPAFLTLEDPPK